MVQVYSDANPYIQEVNRVLSQFPALVIEYSDNETLFMMLMMYHEDLVSLRNGLELSKVDPYLTQEDSHRIKIATEKAIGDFCRFIDQI